MGPKKKDKKNKKGGKQKEKPPKTLKSEYLAQIADRNALLAEARKKIQKVEDAYFDTEKRYEQTQEDMADIIKYLQHEIEENELEIATFDEQIEIYKAEIAKNDNYYQSIITNMETEYEEKEKSLQYQIQQNRAKLSGFDEVKQQREEFLKKKAQLLEKMQEMEAKREKEIYEAEKEAIIKQDSLQKEMEYNLAKLSIDFRQATDIAIGESTNKLIRDNIILGNMLTCTQEVFERARDTYHKVYELEKGFRYNAELLDDQNLMIWQKYSKQVNSIETLLRSHEDLHEKIKMSEKLIKDNRRIQRQIAEQECIYKDKVAEFNDLLKELNEDADVFNSVKGTFKTLRRHVFGLELSLLEAAKAVKRGIEVENMTKLVEEETDDGLPEKVKNEKEAEDALIEFKYKAREAAIEEAIEKLGNGLLLEVEMSNLDYSDLQLSNHQDSTIMEI